MGNNTTKGIAVLGIISLFVLSTKDSINAIAFQQNVGLTASQLVIHNKNLEDTMVVDVADNLDKKFDFSDFKAQEKINKILDNSKKLTPSKLLSARKLNRDKNNQNKDRNKLIDKLENDLQSKVSSLFGSNISLVNLNEKQASKYEEEVLKDDNLLQQLKKVQDINYTEKSTIEKLGNSLFGGVKVNAATSICSTMQFNYSVAKTYYNYVSIWYTPNGNGDIRNGISDVVCDYLVQTGTTYMNYVASPSGTGQCVLNQFSLISANQPRNLFIFGSVRSALCGIYDSNTIRNNVQFRK